MRLAHLCLLAVLAAASASPAAAQYSTPSAAGPLAAPATRAAPLTIIDLTPWRTRWVATAQIGGKPRRMLFDTGGGVTLFSKAVADDAGCTPWGRMTGFNMMAARGDGPRCEGVGLGLGGRTFTPGVTGLIDMGSLNPKDAELDGLLSLDTFENQAVTLDLRGGHIVVESPASLAERTAGMRPVPLRLAREMSGLALAAYVAVPTPKGRLWFELDSGNGGTILISRPNAGLFGLQPAGEGPQPVNVTVEGGPAVRSEFAFTPDMTIDGNLGMPFLRDWIVTLDLATGRAWMAPARGA